MIILNKIALFTGLFMIWQFSSCSTNNCQHTSIPSVPDGYVISKICEIETPNELKKLQFVEGGTGYILDGDTDLLKTENNGSTWERLPIVKQEIPIDLLFVDAKIGYISLYSDTSNVQLIKTIDGGLSWNRIEYPNIKGRIYRIVKDKNKNLYATIRSGDFQSSTLIKSIDNAQTWQSLNTDNIGYGTEFSISNDRLYVASNGKIIILDKSGQYIKTIETPCNTINTIVILDKDHLIVGNDDLTVSSIDGGNHWTYFSNEVEFQRIIQFTDSSNGLMMYMRVCSESDYGRDLLSFEGTMTAGMDWDKSLDFDPSWNYFSMDVVSKDSSSVILVPYSSKDSWGIYEIHKN